MLSDYLVEFSVVVQQGALSQAAKRLNMSQSTLTRHLAMLESTLGTKLMERSATGVRPTEEGRFVYDVALQMVALGDDLIQNLRDYKNRTGGQFSPLIVGGLSELKAISKSLETARVRLSSSRGDISLQYLPPGRPLSVELALEQHELDIFLTFTASAQRFDGLPNLRQMELLSVSAVAIMEPTHPFAGAASLSHRDLRDATFIRMAGTKDNAGAVWDEFARQCETKGFSPLHHTLSHQSMPLCEQGHPESIIVQLGDSLCARLAREQGCAVLPIVDLSFQVAAVIRDDDRISLDLLEEMKSLL